MRLDFPLPENLVKDAILRALSEDLGDAGDITTRATIPATMMARAVMRSRQSGTISGMTVASVCCRLVDPAIEVNFLVGDGDRVEGGTDILTLTGPARGMLVAERTMLNFMSRMSGIATATHQLVQEVTGTGVTIACTRKTTPGLRAFEKYAVQCGGGKNHRYGLYDAVMIKDNHISAAGGITPALMAAQQALGHTLKVEIEVDRLEQLEEVLRVGADSVLLDNMNNTTLREAVHMAKGAVILEASGNMTEKTVNAVARTGVDVISSGWITHSAPILDLGLDFV